MRWARLILISSFLVGCRTAEVSSPEIMPVVASPTSSPSPTSSMPTPSLTPRPQPTPISPSATTPQEEVVVTLPDCSTTFWDPFERELRVLSAAEEPGILTVMTVDVNHARLIYNTTQLNQEEAIRAFERSSGFEVIGIGY